MNKEEALLRKLQREKEKVALLELQIEDRTRDIFLANQKIQAAADFLREIYRTMPGALIVFGPTGVIEAVNDAALMMLGYAEAELIGRDIAQIFEANQAPTLDQVTREATSSPVLRSERSCRTKTGDPIPVLLSAVRMQGAVGNAARGVVCVALDVRDQKKLELELRQAQKLEAVGRLAAGVAHEINTPVQFVSDSIHFVEDAVKDVFSLLDRLIEVRASATTGMTCAAAIQLAEQAEEDADLPYLREHLPKALARASEGVERVATIVRSMKAFAHPEGREMAPIDLNRAIESTLVIARNEYKYVADLEVSLGNLPPVVCHAGDVNQAVLNVVVNAAHAIGDLVQGTDGRGKISVRTRRDGPDAVVEISDTGGGIPETVRGKIFDPFFTTKEVGRGTGQGLAISHSVVVEKHGGQISFDTVIGRGTTFTLRLPIEGKAAPESVRNVRAT